MDLVPDFIQIISGLLQSDEINLDEVSRISYQFCNSIEGLNWSLMIFDKNVPEQIKIVAITIIQNFLNNHQDKLDINLLNQIQKILFENCTMKDKKHISKARALYAFNIIDDYQSFFKLFMNNQIDDVFLFLDEFLNILSLTDSKSVEIKEILSDNEIDLLLYNFATANINIEDDLMFRVLKSIIISFDIDVNEIILELLQKGINQENTRSETLELAVSLIENFEDKSILANIFTVEILSLLLNANENDYEVFCISEIINAFILAGFESYLQLSLEIFANANVNSAALLCPTIFRFLLEIDEIPNILLINLYKYNCDDEYEDIDYVIQLSSLMASIYQKDSENIFNLFQNSLNDLQNEENPMQIILTISQFLSYFHNQRIEFNYSELLPTLLQILEIDISETKEIVNEAIKNVLVIAIYADESIDKNLIFENIFTRISHGFIDLIDPLYAFIKRFYREIQFSHEIIRFCIEHTELIKFTGIMMNNFAGTEEFQQIFYNSLQTTDPHLFFSFIFEIEKSNLTNENIEQAIQYIRSIPEEYLQDDSFFANYLRLYYKLIGNDINHEIIQMLDHSPGNLSVDVALQIIIETNFDVTNVFAKIMSKVNEMFRNSFGLILEIDEKTNFISLALKFIQLFKKFINNLPEIERNQCFELLLDICYQCCTYDNIFVQIFDLLFEFIDYIRNELVEQILQTSVIPFTKEKYDDIIIISIGKIHRLLLSRQVPAEMIYNVLKDVFSYIDMNVYITILQNDNLEIFYQQILEFYHSLLLSDQ